MQTCKRWHFSYFNLKFPQLVYSFSFFLLVEKNKHKWAYEICFKLSCCLFLCCGSLSDGFLFMNFQNGWKMILKDFVNVIKVHLLLWQFFLLASILFQHVCWDQLMHQIFRKIWSQQKLISSVYHIQTNTTNQDTKVLFLSLFQRLCFSSQQLEKNLQNQTLGLWSLGL